MRKVVEMTVCELLLMIGFIVMCFGVILYNCTDASEMLCKVFTCSGTGLAVPYILVMFKDEWLTRKKVHE